MPFMRSESCSFIWHPKVVTWYRFMARADGSRGRPAGRRGRAARSPGVVRRARFADDGHLDLPRILELLLDLACDLVRQQDRAVVVEGAGVEHDADLPAGLHRVDLVDALVACRDVLEVAQALDVLLERLAAGARARARERIGGLDDDRLHR